MFMYLKQCKMSGKLCSPDQMPHSAVSDLGLENSFDISCKMSPMKTIYMKCQILCVCVCGGGGGWGGACYGGGRCTLLSAELAGNS